MVAGRTGLTIESIQADVLRARKEAARAAITDKKSQSRNTKTDVADLVTVTYKGTRAEQQAERGILGLMMLDPECRTQALSSLKPGWFSGSYRKAFETLALDVFNKNVDVTTLIAQAGQEYGAVLAELSMQEQPQDVKDRLRILRDCSLVLKRRRLQELKAEIEALQAGAEGFPELLGEYQVLLRETKTSPSRGNGFVGEGG